MKQFFTLFVLVLLSCNKKEQGAENSAIDPPPVKNYTPKKIIRIWFENRSTSAIWHNTDAPYMNSLIARGTLFTNFRCDVTSFVDYLMGFCGSTLGVKNNKCISGRPFNAENEYTVLRTTQRDTAFGAGTGYSMVWYNEDLPEAGSTVCRNENYVAKHNPTYVFNNVPDSISLPLTALPPATDEQNLPDLIEVTPNLQNDMHDGTIAQGDTWLKDHFSSYIEAAYEKGWLVEIYFDEPTLGDSNGTFPTIVVGKNVKAGNVDTTNYGHYNMLKTNMRLFGADSTFGNLKEVQGISYDQLFSH